MTLIEGISADFLKEKNYKNLCLNTYIQSYLTIVAMIVAATTPFFHKLQSDLTRTNTLTILQWQNE